MRVWADGAIGETATPDTICDRDIHPVIQAVASGGTGGNKRVCKLYLTQTDEVDLSQAVGRRANGSAPLLRGSKRLVSKTTRDVQTGLFSWQANWAIDNGFSRR